MAPYRVYSACLWALLAVSLTGMLYFSSIAEGNNFLPKLNPQVKLHFPCEAVAVSRIWVDDEVFWDYTDTGLMLLDPCGTLELYLDWTDSIVVEWLIRSDNDEAKMIRFRFFPDGTFQPEYKIPESKLREL
jgi:hypothetical protein